MKAIRQYPGWFIFGCLVAVALIAQSRYYFVFPIHEVSDHAVNALQINQAKHLAEIHGNYSRFHFDHPGPAFFYVYALGEWLFYDLLHLTGSPVGAHFLASLLLQAACFAAALSLLARWVRAPLFLPLALAVGMIHFGLASDMFLSIWPPNVLVMPFLLFWVATASVLLGRGQDLPWLAVSGSILVHGHSAQPLFVLGLFFTAYLSLLLRYGRSGERLTGPWRTYRRAHVITAAIVGVSILPILLDLFSGRHSNFAAILRHLHYSGTDHKPLLDSALYFLTFFAYFHDQDTLFQTAGASHLAFFRGHAWIYAAWAVGLGLALAALSGRIGRLSAEARRTGWLMLGLWVLTAALCLYWGVLQTGPMFDFNGYFYYSVIYALALIFCALLAQALPPPPRGMGLGLCLVALAAGSQTLRIGGGWEPTTGVDLREATLKALQADPRRELPKFLVFAHDDWATAAAVGLALERAGSSFYVSGAWTFMFQNAHVAPPSLLLDPSAKLSVWRMVDAAPTPGGVALSPDIAVEFEPGYLDPAKDSISFAKGGNLEQYVVSGIVAPDSDSTWTELPEATLQFRPRPAHREVNLELTASPFLCGAKVTKQPLEIWFNGVLLAHVDVTQAGKFSARVPSALWNKSPVATLRFHLPNATAPAQLGLSGDPRLLGLSISRLDIGS